MRRLVTGTALSVAIVPLLLAFPVATRPTAAPHPVAASQETLKLGSFAAPAAGIQASVATEAPSALHRAGRATSSLYVKRDTTKPFSAVAATWRADDGLGEVTFKVRAKQASGWTAWRNGDDDAGHTATGRETRKGSGLVWLGPSTGVELQLTGEAGKTPSDVQVDLINPGTSAADANPAGNQPRDTAHADVGRPAILTRAQWGADERIMTWTPEYSSTIKAGFIHHTVQSNNYTAADVPAMIRADYQYHAVSRGWGDIGYNFLIDYFGRIWQGRAGDINRPTVGAHTGGFNTDTFGIAIIGDTTTHGIGSPVTAGISRVFAWKLAQYHRDPLGTTQLTSTGGGTSRYPAGTVVTKPVIMGHRDVGQTDCPGTYAYPQIPGIRNTVNLLMAPVLANPALSTTTPAVGGPMLGISALLRRSTGGVMEIIDNCTHLVVYRSAGTWSMRDFLWRPNWNLHYASGAPAPPGAYRVRMTVNSNSAQTVWDYPFQLVANAGTAAPAGTEAPHARAASTFVPVSPTRVLDTRTGLGTSGVGKLAASSSLRLALAGRGGVPSTGATAVLLNVTAKCATENTWLTAAPSDGVVPATAPVVPVANSIVSTTVAVSLGSDGAVILRNARGFVDVAVDVSGYYTSATTAGRFHPLSPAVVYDAHASNQPLKAGERRIVPIAGLGGVPTTATSVAVELTAFTSIYGGSMLLYPAGGAVMSGSTAEWQPSALVRTHAVVGLGGGSIGMYSRVNLVYPIVHVVGYYAPSTVAGGLRYVPLNPTRVFDTRSSGGPISSSSPRSVVFAGQYGLPSSGPQAVALSLRSFSATAPSWLKAYPTGTAAPTYGVLWNDPALQYAGIAWPGLGGGAVTFAPSTGSTQAVGDLSGYFTP
ncbi:MAG: N-acetylmuramoyl-L-alanine amidase [Mycobacteriales bacterium]